MTPIFDILRVLLGAVLLLTGLDYFLPSLPVVSALVPDIAWSDPMAVRLLDAFESSGLLAVAKFIHVAAGGLLIVNRLVPFALAASMPVNVCGAYIAVVVEGGAGIVLLALALIALHTFLMFCYLPYYARMLRQDELADGEGPEPGQHYNSLFVNPLSGAPAIAYAGALVVLLLAYWFYWDVVMFANATMGRYTLLVPTALLLVGLARALMGKKSGSQ